MNVPKIIDISKTTNNKIDISKILNQIELSKDASNFLLKLTRKALEYYFTYNKPLHPNDIELPQNANIKNELVQKRATFVTLEKQNATRGYSLRGCIGHLIAINPVYIDVLQNTYAAAFQDYRFPPLEAHELPFIKIKLSILTPQIKLRYTTTQELTNFLQTYRPGVVLQQLNRQATFLPSVWKELPNVQEFLTHLCAKAGLNFDCWLNNPEIFIYFAQEIEE